MKAAARGNRAGALAARRELLVALATLQRLRLARSLHAPAQPMLAAWRVSQIAVPLLAGLLAQRAPRWFAFARLFVVARNLLRLLRQRTGPQA